jgi:hypothetical protein
MVICFWSCRFNITIFFKNYFNHWSFSVWKNPCNFRLHINNDHKDSRVACQSVRSLTKQSKTFSSSYIYWTIKTMVLKVHLKKKLQKWSIFITKSFSFKLMGSLKNNGCFNHSFLKHYVPLHELFGDQKSPNAFECR